MPIWTCLTPKLAVSVAIRMSHAAASSVPPPKVAPLIAANPPLSVRLIKQAVQGGRDAPAEAAGVLEAALFGLTWGSEDHAEAVRAFFEKRAPRWKGR